LALLATDAPAQTSRRHTQTTVFQAFTATGAPTLPATRSTGRCLTGSRHADRSDAWRCTGSYGGLLLTWDPCFASPAAPGVVLCPNNALTSATELRLTRPLPTGKADSDTASPRQRPWLIELYPKLSTGPVRGHIRCVLADGRRAMVEGLRLNYLCLGLAGTVALWGHVHHTTEPWTILAASIYSTHHFKATRSFAIFRAWT
jgi:hypothetical protein